MMKPKLFANIISIFSLTQPHSAVTKIQPLETPLSEENNFPMSVHCVLTLFHTYKIIMYYLYCI